MRTAGRSVQGLGLEPSSASSSEASADSPILLDLSSPSAPATDAWRLVDGWQAQAMLAMDMASVSTETWRRELRQEVTLMLRQLDARADAPSADQLSPQPSQPSQPSMVSSISTEQETPDVLDAAHRLRRPVSPTFDTEQQSSSEEAEEEMVEGGDSGEW